MPFVPAALGEFNVILAYLFGIVLIYLVGRMFLMPIRLVFRLIYNGLIGGVMLWLLNYVGAHFDFSIAINPVTALIAGFLGLPGVVLLALFKIFIG
jgi:inhibitor of the pro-sigma K processing machinery